MLEQQARASNEALSEKLSSLMYEVQPKTQVGYLKEELIYRAKLLQFECMQTIDRAREGDPAARETLLKVAGVAVGVVGVLCLRRKLVRGRKHK